MSRNILSKRTQIATNGNASPHGKLISSNDRKLQSWQVASSVVGSEGCWQVVKRCRSHFGLARKLTCAKDRVVAKRRG